MNSWDEADAKRTRSVPYAGEKVSAWWLGCRWACVAARSRWWTAAPTMVAAMVLCACAVPPDSAPPRVVFASRTAWPTPATPLPVLDTAAAARVFQQWDDAANGALTCWRKHMSATSDTLAEAKRRAGRVAAAYRGFADVLRANQWPDEAERHVRGLAAEYDRVFTQYETLAQATSVDRYRAVRYWMNSMTTEGWALRAAVRQALGLPAEPKEPFAIFSSPSPATAATAC